MEKIFEVLPARAGFGVEFGQRSIGSGTLAEHIKAAGWGALYLDREATSALQTQAGSGTKTITLAREDVGANNINALFAKYDVPKDLDCLVIDIDGQDYWVWDAIDPSYTPSLVIIEFNAHVGHGVAATIHADANWTYQRNKNYGASLTALRTLAAGKGYRLIHIHGPWNLYFIRDDLHFPAGLALKDDVTGEQLSLLTDTVAFYDTLCGLGTRPSWFDAPEPDTSQAPWELVAPATPTKTVDIEGLNIEVLADKHDVVWYQQRKTFEEKQSLLYKFIASEGFTNFVDVGANVGYISTLAKRACPQLNIIALEADPRLVKLLRRNFQKHGLNGAHVINAIVGTQDAPSAAFSLNPGSTLDNRVLVPQWQQIRVPAVRLDRVLTTLQIQGKTFFKIDTQGFELHVLRGLESKLMNSQDWLLKMEFAPDWLRSQGTDPMELLEYLQLRYEFVEFPERIPFATPNFNTLFGAPIKFRQHAELLKYVVALNKNDLGWIDLLLRPQVIKGVILSWHQGSWMRKPSSTRQHPTNPHRSAYF